MGGQPGERPEAGGPPGVQALERQLRDLCYAVSHDLRAPLRAIAGFADILMEDHAAELSAEAAALLRRIRDRAGRMDAMLQGLLELSRIQRAQPELEELDLARLATPVVEKLRQAEPQRPPVRVEIASPLPARGDRALTGRLLELLLDNAWKFTRPVPEPRIAVGAAQDPAWFAVRDNGVGFERGAALRLFAPFQRFHGENEFSGLGLGLALAQAIVARHGGEIAVESAPGAGTEVRFRLAGESR